MNPAKEFKLTDLNKWCLSKIFKHLDYEDLLSVKKASSAFDDALDSVISMACFELKTQSTTDELLKHFGHKLHYLNIEIENETAEQKKTISRHYKTLIERYCSNGNIKNAVFRNLDLSKEFLKDNAKFFSSLEILIVGFDNIDPDALEPSDIINFNVFPSIAASQLKKCVIDATQCDPPKNFDYKNSEMSTNITMKHLDLGIYSFDLIYLSHFPNIEVLELTVFTRYSLEPIANMDKLKSLLLSFDICDFQNVLSVLQELAKKNSLKYLALGHKPNNSIGTYAAADYDKDEYSLAITLNKMTGLKKLRLNTVHLLDRQLQQLGHKLKNLRKFDYGPSEAIHKIEVKPILSKFEKFVKVAKNLTNLIIDVKMDGPNPEQSQRFYDSIANIRRSQAADAVLHLWFPGTTDVVETADQKEYVDL